MKKNEKYSAGNECSSNRKAFRRLTPARAAIESTDDIYFEGFIVEKGGLLDAEQKKLYESGDLKKIKLFLRHFYFSIEIQQWIIKRNDLKVAKLFLANRRFAVPAHYTLVKFASEELWNMVIPVTKLCNEAEVLFAKKAPKKRLLHYRNCHEMCKKAENICNDVRGIKK